MDSPLISFLQSPDAYAHSPDSVTHVQTHISHVFIASPYVYKCKKSVDFGFLDYSSLEKRRKFCDREVELNRRLSDGIYLGVAAIVKDGDSYQLTDEKAADDKVVEYAVKMKQLPEEYFLHSYLEQDTLSKKHLDRVADKLADFYLSQQPDEEILQYGEIESIKVNTDENFEQTRDFVDETIAENAYKAIQYFTNQYFEKRGGLFERRVAQKRIVDGHGDLHLEHIHITPDSVQIYDCIEFNDRFRYGDLAVDLAFLAMDLDFNDRWSDERYFIDQMAEKLDDPDLPKIIDFYKCYRAYVKGKVKSLQSGEPEVPKKDRQRARQTAQQYFDLSLRYALLGSRPSAIIFMGKVGTGKSTLARHLHKKLSIEYFSTDEIRKRLAGLPLEERTPSTKRDTLYSEKMSEQTYQQLLDKAESNIRAGKSIILDATFSSRSSREKLIKKLTSLNVQLLFVEAQAPENIIKQRLKARENQDDVISDARIEDFDKLDRRYEPPAELEGKQLVEVATDRDLTNTIEQLYRALAERNIITYS
ncbi:AAA family ATPase [Fodinibius sp. N2]|uniref:bifunctional aminoglycoside phosphotransferase/ATP-binding protein n=1 Tax=Fodinibius alkaliphilus TaxID=3140241 RepID=UPI00315A2339